MSLKAITLSIAVLLSGCTALDLVDKINPMSEEQGINVNAQLGKENTHTESKQLVQASVGDTLKGETINQTNTFTMTWWALGMLWLSGVMMMPIAFLSGIKDVFKKKE